jgi:FixJ family two-component response regulator
VRNNKIIKIRPSKQLPLYQKIAKKARQLKLLGLPNKKIAEKLGVSERTLANALRHCDTLSCHSHPPRCHSRPSASLRVNSSGNPEPKTKEVK